MKTTLTYENLNFEVEYHSHNDTIEKYDPQDDYIIIDNFKLLDREGDEEELNLWLEEMDNQLIEYFTNKLED